MSYQNPPSSDEDETAVPLVAIITPPPTTTTRFYSLMWMVAVVAGMMMLLAGGAVLMFETNDAGLMTTATGGLVVRTKGGMPCLPASGTFSGISKTAGSFSFEFQDEHFETCYQYKATTKTCWSKSYYITENGFTGWLECIPDGGDWYSLDSDISPVNYHISCGPPCQEVHQQ